MARNSLWQTWKGLLPEEFQGKLVVTRRLLPEDGVLCSWNEVGRLKGGFSNCHLELVREIYRVITGADVELFAYYLHIIFT